MHAAVAPADSQFSPCSCSIRCGEAGIKAQHAGGFSRGNSASLVGLWQCLPSQSQRTLMSTWLAMTQTTTLSQASRHLPSESASAQLRLRKMRAGEAVHGCCLPPQPRGSSRRANRPRQADALSPTITPHLNSQMMLHALTFADTSLTSHLLPAELSAGVAARLPLAGCCGAAVSKVQHDVLAMVWPLCAEAPHNSMLLTTGWAAQQAQSLCQAPLIKAVCCW